MVVLIDQELGCKIEFPDFGVQSKVKLESVTFNPNAITKILNYKEEGQSFLFQICREQVTMTKFSHAGITQKTSKIQGLASSSEDGKLMRFYHLS